MASLGSRIGLVSGFTMISRVLGLARDMATSSLLGASVWNSAFITAFTLPNLFRRLLGEGTLTAALMPNLSEAMSDGGRSAVHVLVNKVLSWLLVICFGLTVVAWCGLEVLERNTSSEKWGFAAELGQILFPYVIFICVAAVLAAALNLFSRFGVPALTAVWLNLSLLAALAIAAGYLGEDARGRVYWLSGGALVGGALQMLAPAVALWREGWRPRLDFGVSPRLRQVALLTVPGILGAAVFQVNIMVSRGLALSVNDAAAALLYYANRLVELPVGVFSIAIATVVFPKLTQALAAGQGAHFSEVYRKGTLLCLMMALPSAAGLIALAPQILGLLFERGLFEASDTAATVPLVVVFALGMPFYSFVAIESRAFFAMKDTRTPVRVALVSFGVNLILSVALMGRFGSLGLAVATNAAAVAQAVLLHRALSAKGYDVRLGSALGVGLKLLGGSVAMGVLVWAAMRFLVDWREAGLLLQLVALGGVIALGAGTYFLLLKLWRIPFRSWLA